mmetsp:Transcript_15764/g.43068  ORF Transcript_15764/g.43068 Transcript_15764/m.43068 type:complete len:208 (+) Transcript_15764:63-686(+)|eukprot:CAMPEP_0117551060 /NCGR_PEP_ID=MMETSP0784-20121206/48996_1 /TAXON_ID=39447 /ORGANISM="" /LENGTH=207 /DNA_ID=CAMNT_0005348087 /DNA_START=26 /DNA_END=649 /DNA_ORIENTATION=-
MAKVPSSSDGSGGDAMRSLDTFDRAPSPLTVFPGATSPSGVAGGSPSPFRSPPLVFPPGSNDEAERERTRRQQELDGDEELAAQLAAQLRLTSPAEHHVIEDSSMDERLPRVGDSRSTGASAVAAPVPEGPGQRYGAQEEPPTAAEYHAMESDGEEAFGAEPRTGVANSAHMICDVLAGLFKGTTWRYSNQANSLTSNGANLDTGLG